MQALVQSLESLVATMACVAFAHFGVALKQPCPHASQAVHRISISTTAAPTRVQPHSTAPLAKDQRQI